MLQRVDISLQWSLNLLENNTLTYLNNVNLILVHPIGRSGSVFLQSLFDGHRDVLMFPALGTIYSKIPKIVFDITSFLDEFIESNKSIFDSSYGYFGLGVSFVSGKFGGTGEENLVVDSSKFKREALRLLKLGGFGERGLSRLDLFKIVHIAYSAVARGEQPTTTKYILYHPHNSEEFPLLIDEWPSIRFLFTLRDPRQNWASWKKVIAIRTGIALIFHPKIEMLNCQINHSSEMSNLKEVYERVGKNQLRLIELQQLHASNKVLLKKLCAWLELEFDDVLLKSTFNGKVWNGNSADRVMTTGFNPLFTDKWHQELNDAEIKFLNSASLGTIESMRTLFPIPAAVLQKGLRPFSLSRRQLLALLLLQSMAYFVAIFMPLKNHTSLLDYLRKRLARVYRFLTLVKNILFNFFSIYRDMQKDLTILERQQSHLQNWKPNSDISFD